MAFTYQSSKLSTPSSTAYNRTVVRTLIGDTSTSRRYNLDDAQVDWFVLNGGNINLSAANAAEALGALYVEAAESKKVGDLAITRREGDRLVKLAEQLRRRAAASATPLVGGVSVADKQAREDDTDRTNPSFTRGRGDYPGTNQPGGNSRTFSDWES